jgi:nucleoside-diphosphate-sugar epimerase
MTIFLTGASGFVGNSIKKYFNNSYHFSDFIRGDKIIINEDIVLHFAGKAHDLNTTFNTNEYYKINTELTKTIFDRFLNSKAKVFITLSSVKAVANELNYELTEDYKPNPITHYGKSKLIAERYILSKQVPAGKRVYILRPCMIHGPGNKGNLNLLYNIVSKGFPWPLGAFENKRSFCSIDNLCFIINELIKNDKIPSGIYNVADDEAISTNELIRLIADGQGKKSYILKIPKFIIILLTKVGDIFKLPLNTERLNKLTETYIVSNKKIKLAINKSLPVTAKDGLMNTLNSFGKSNIH